MTPEDAVTKSNELNMNGRHRVKWYYYPAYHSPEKGWFVMRRPKYTVLKVAVFEDGTVSGLEKLNTT